MSGGAAAMGVLLWLLIFLGAGAAAPLALAVADARAVAPSRKINLVVVLGDDFGSYDGAAYRGGSIRTPTVDALVSQGLLMDSFYVFQICSPTRSALVSGRYPFHVSQALPEGFHAISRQYELLPALLKRSGNYRTYHVGKWRESTAPAHALARNHVCLLTACTRQTWAFSTRATRRTARALTTRSVSYAPATTSTTGMKVGTSPPLTPAQAKTYGQRTAQRLVGTAATLPSSMGKPQWTSSSSTRRSPTPPRRCTSTGKNLFLLSTAQFCIGILYCFAW